MDWIWGPSTCSAVIFKTNCKITQPAPPGSCPPWPRSRLSLLPSPPPPDHQQYRYQRAAHRSGRTPCASTRSCPAAAAAANPGRTSPSPGVQQQPQWPQRPPRPPATPPYSWRRATTAAGWSLSSRPTMQCPPIPSQARAVVQPQVAPRPPPTALNTGISPAVMHQ